jgi:hypothetical protein
MDFGLLPRDLQISVFAWRLTFERAEAARRLQRAVRARMSARIHFGHARQALWPLVKEQLQKRGVLRRLYPYRLVRLEWRSELESWDRLSNLHALVRDVEANVHWGTRAPSLLPLAPAPERSHDARPADEGEE